ncbi:glycoside hydrolase family 79 protein [Abortiporus biennis]|nr:glycoside hydrolase family 79 protein [Abortiporus biennis]
MLFGQSGTPSLLGSLALISTLTPAALAAVSVTAPTNPTTNTIVYSNFLGVSLELSFINYYFGNDSSTVPQAVVNYFSSLYARGSGQPVRLRLGGNSMDSSVYDSTQQSILQLTNPDANSDDQPVNYGPKLWEVMNTMADKVGQAQYLVGLSLRTPNDSNSVVPLASDASKFLGDRLDALLLGNEPDLYTAHGQRPNIANYTTTDYIGEYWEIFKYLGNTPSGDVVDENKIAGPTICCFWDFASVLQSGWYDQFKKYLKYVTLQHYPQNNCFANHAYQLDYYLHHANAVSLTQWQANGINWLHSQPDTKPLLMDEFSSASCGGIPGISDTFGAALWTVDYALQMATAGYSAAYLHTRERGITYNLFDPPAGPAANSGAWTTNPTWYAYFPISEALQSTSGSRVVDLNTEGSMTNKAVSSAGYAVYDAGSSQVRSLVLFNFADATPIDFTLPQQIFTASAVTVRYLTAPSVTEKTQISWGNQTYNGVADGLPVTSTLSSALPDKQMDCANGCTVTVPGPALAVVFIGGVPSLTAPPANNTSSGSGSGSASGSANNATSSSNNKTTQGSGSPSTSSQLGLTTVLGLVAFVFATLL